ncbi:CBS domain-containing protein [Magnetospirillum sp. 15-1]|uniref:CBS domain-containing protein n=1 Tax=Magnetospirillum sp. 15-1 TaxID=1979370 RepID=UPI000BBBAEDE|nr:CBS domain-containing protein [Magnetospirillum sp. 15-1]
MKVKNWMLHPPVTVSSDALLSEAKHILTTRNLQALPVVDDGRLRGLLTRAHCIRTTLFMLKSQDPNEFDYFTTRLKVKDVMVRNPATVGVETTMEECLAKGRDLGVAQFPVVDGDCVVGIISANEIFNLAAHFLGAWERRSGVTLGPMELEPGVIGRTVTVIEDAGGEVLAIYPIASAPPLTPKPEAKLIVRFHAKDFAGVVGALQQASFPVLERIEALH